ncbi:MAG: hypothetical protein KBH07_06505 [Flavobacteriales bacterium]|nr:hypothetical protein [Flavobacteriales bacterium]MBP9079576.1 hypothetical protein [Flavobacteriales bacterium]
MDIALKKLALVQRLLSIWDEAALQRVAKVIEKEAAAEEAVDFTEEEIAELDRRRVSRLNGVSKGLSAEESIRRLRASQSRDEAA